MPLVLKFSRDEEIYINGANVIVGKGAILKIHTPNTKILRSKDIMPESEAEISVPHAHAYIWFSHLTMKNVMYEEECIVLGNSCVEYFPALAPIAKRKDWFSLYIEMRKLLRG